ncbi:MAG TPA: mechanosensitive ion channel family protein [Symbiobacteriaceae bacterium]
MRVLRGMVSRLTSQGAIRLDEQKLDEAARPMRFVVLMAGLSMGLKGLGTRLPGLAQTAEFDWVQKGTVMLVILGVTRLVNGLMKVTLDWYLHNLTSEAQPSGSNELLPLIRRTASVVLYFIALSIILKTFGVDITALVATAGVASLAVALAAQDTLSNMLGGIMILVDRPFRVGDVVELTDGRKGTVAEIGLRSTRIRQFDGNALVVPNKDMANTRIINYAYPDRWTVIRQTISLPCDADVEKAKETLKAILAAHPDILKEPAPAVWLTAITSTSLELSLSCWVRDYDDKARVTDDLNMKILRTFRDAGIQIAVSPIS